MARKTLKADALDKHIGNRIREYRENLGLTQHELAGQTDVSYQQIHKYERGTNRISAGRLGLIAEVLHVDVQQFYEGFMSGATIQDLSRQDSHLCLEIARNFRRVNNPDYQQALHFLVRTLAD
jgi:transcriptional regulator with XRE-family HTH domain